MSAYSTLRITRSRAIVMVVEDLGRMSDDTLEKLVDYLLRDRLYNCRIVADGEENDEAELGL